MDQWHAKHTLHTGDAEKVGNDEDLPFASVYRQSLAWERRKIQVVICRFNSNHWTSIVWIHSLVLRWWQPQLSWRCWDVWTVPWWWPPAGTSPFPPLLTLPPETSRLPPFQGCCWRGRGSTHHNSLSQTDHFQDTPVVCHKTITERLRTRAG